MFSMELNLWQNSKFGLQFSPCDAVLAIQPLDFSPQKSVLAVQPLYLQFEPCNSNDPYQVTIRSLLFIFSILTINLTIAC